MCPERRIFVTVQKAYRLLENIEEMPFDQPCFQSELYNIHIRQCDLPDQ